MKNTFTKRSKNRTMTQKWLLTGLFTLVALIGYGQVTSLRTGDWSNPSTWNGGSVPAAGSTVTILSGHKVTLNTNATVSSLTVSGTLEYQRVLVNDPNGYTPRELTVSGNITVNSGGALQTNLGSVVHKLSVGGNIVNNGTIDLSTNDDGSNDRTGVELVFTGATNATVTGTGSRTDFFTINLQKTGNATVEINPNNYSVRSNLSGNNRGFVHLPVNGTLKLSGSSPITSYLFTNSNYYLEQTPTFTNTGKIWLNNFNLNLQGSNGNFIHQGKLQVTSGQITFGDGANASGAASEGLYLRNGSELIVDGGTVNASGNVSASVNDAITFTMSDGSINVGTVYNTGAQTFLMSSTSNTINITGGIINLLQSNGDASLKDYFVRGTNPVISGGNLAIGAMMMPGSEYGVEGYAPFMIVYSGQNVMLDGNTTIGGFSVSSGAVLDLNQKNVFFTGSYLANDGTINSTGSNVYFRGTTPQQIDGDLALDNVIIDNAQGVTLNPGSELTVNTSLTMTDGLLKTNTNKVILGPTATITGETATSHVYGLLQTERNVNSTSSVDFGGMGFILTPNAAPYPGLTTVLRENGNAAVLDETSGANSIERTFDVTVGNTADNGSFDLKMDMTYLKDELNGVNEGNIAIFKTQDDVTWNFLGAGVVTNSTATSTDVSLASINGFSKVTAGTNPTPLPVEFLSFSAKNTGEQVELTWLTATEKDNDHFVIESSNGTINEFTTIGKVYSKMQNSTTVQTYNFNDTEKATGTRYYRLKQVDLDGTYAYSKVISIDFGKGVQVKALPNPFVTSVDVNVQVTETGKAEIALTNLTGQTVWSKSVNLEKGVNTVRVENVENLPAGVYVLTTLLNGEVNVQKLVRQ